MIEGAMHDDLEFMDFSTADCSFYHALLLPYLYRHDERRQECHQGTDFSRLERR